jgi:hypothetical protein
MSTIALTGDTFQGTVTQPGMALAGAARITSVRARLARQEASR